MATIGGDRPIGPRIISKSAGQGIGGAIDIGVLGNSEGLGRESTTSNSDLLGALTGPSNFRARALSPENDLVDYRSKRKNAVRTRRTPPFPVRDRPLRSHRHHFWPRHRIFSDPVRRSVLHHGRGDVRSIDLGRGAHRTFGGTVILRRNQEAVPVGILAPGADAHRSECGHDDGCRCLRHHPECPVDS